MSWKDTIQEVKPTSWRDSIQEEHTAPSELETDLRQGVSGVTAGFDDELIGALGAAGRVAGVKNLGSWKPLSPDSHLEYDSPTIDPDKLTEAYRSNRDAIRLDKASDREAFPVRSIIASGAGAALSPLSGLGLLSSGAAIGAGESNADLTKGEYWDVAKDTATGAILNKVIGTVVPKVVNGAIDLGKMGAKKVLSATLGPSSEAIDSYLSNPKAINDAVSYSQQADNLANATNTLKDRVSQLDNEAWKTLSDDPTVVVSRLIDGIKDVHEGLHINGNLIGKSAKKADAILGDLSEDITKFGSHVSPSDLKSIIQDLDNNINWDDPSATDSNWALSQVRTYFDSILKKNPEYKAAMEPVKENIDVINYLKKKFSLKDTSNGFVSSDATSSNLKNVLNETKGVSQDALKQLEEQTGLNALQASKDYGNAAQFQGSFANGSRRTVGGATTGGAIGAGLGSLLGPGGTVVGGVIGSGLGSLGGMAADKEGGRWAKNILDYYLQNNPAALGRFAEPLLSAFKKGPAAFAVTQSILNKDPEFQNKLRELSK